MKRIVLILSLVVLNPTLGHSQEYDEKRAQQTENTIAQKVKVFPNPATNVVNILDIKNSAKADILISDINGNIVLTHQWRIKNNALNIPISTLEAGIYIIKIRSQEQNITTKFYKK